MRRPYGLPNLSRLGSFEAAARHESFRRAALELNVTPAAVSHQVKALEGDVGQALFQRHHRGVALTEAGALLFATLQRGFAEFGETIENLRQKARSAVVIEATTAVSALWLTPRLGRFWRCHDHISVEQRVSDEPIGGSEADLSIRYGHLARDAGNCRKILSDTVVALGSPDFAERSRIKSLDDLRCINLIHLRSSHADWMSWDEWFSALGHPVPRDTSFGVNNYTIALQAAEDGLGAVLGWEGLTKQLVEDGRLVALLPDRVPSPLAFYIRARSGAPADALLLRDWLVQQH